MSSMMPLLMSQMMGGQNAGTQPAMGGDMASMMNMLSGMGGQAAPQTNQTQQTPFGDMGSIMQMMNGFQNQNANQGQQNNVSSLLEALKPFLSEDRRQKIGSTMQLLQTMPHNGQMN